MGLCTDEADRHIDIAQENQAQSANYNAMMASGKKKISETVDPGPNCSIASAGRRRSNT